MSTETGWPKISTFTVLLQYILKKCSTSSTEKFSTFSIPSTDEIRKMSKIWISRSFQYFRSALENSGHFRTSRKFRTSRHPELLKKFIPAHFLAVGNTLTRSNRSFYRWTFRSLRHLRADGDEPDSLSLVQTNPCPHFGGSGLARGHFLGFSKTGSGSPKGRSGASRFRGDGEISPYNKTIMTVK